MGVGYFKKCALKAKDKISMLGGLVKHATSFSNTVKLTEDKAFSKAYQKTLRILVEKNPNVGLLLSDPDVRTEIGGYIKGVAFEIEYSEHIRPIFFYPVIWPWLQRGHFPCGWDGKMISQHWAGNSPEDLPEGRLRVY